MTNETVEHTEERRGPGRPRVERPDMRPQLRDDDPRARAEARAKELLGNHDFDTAERDEFGAPTPPDGWTYEWKRHKTLNATDPSYEVELAQTGWEPVPTDRHPEMMPRDWNGKVIEKKGMILMERPAIITQRVKDRDFREARQRVQGVEDRLAGAPRGQFERNHEQVRPRVKNSYSPVEIPD